MPFTLRLTLATNRQYRLPTEAEWEYAYKSESLHGPPSPEIGGSESGLPEFGGLEGAFSMYDSIMSAHLI
jgi:hypothetical protein